MINAVVKGSGVCSRGDEHYHKRTFLSLVMRFLDPLREFSPVWRIAKHPFTPPILGKTVLCLGEVFRAFRVLMCATRVKVEMELRVQLVKKSLRRCPLDGCA